MHNSHARHGTTFDPNPPPLAPLAGSIKRPTKQISIAALSATPHLLLVVISRPQWLVVKYLAVILSLHSPRHLFHLQLPALSKLAAAPTRQSCLMLPRMDIACYLGKVQVDYFWCSIYYILHIEYHKPRNKQRMQLLTLWCRCSICLLTQTKYLFSENFY